MLDYTKIADFRDVIMSRWRQKGSPLIPFGTD